MRERGREKKREKEIEKDEEIRLRGRVRRYK
jgi:hypothetical protein